MAFSSMTSLPKTLFEPIIGQFYQHPIDIVIFSTSNKEKSSEHYRMYKNYFEIKI